MIVFVHGVPETAAIWTKVRRAIGQDSVALSLPGFGGPRPAGFAATKDDYVRWLLDELAQIDGPIDLVGHDWGAGFTYRVATAYGDRLRSWVGDVANCIHPDYVWHDFAKTWQTPGAGEAYFESLAGVAPEEQAAQFEALGTPAKDALEMAAAGDATMAGCILDLYRSATPNPHHHWGPWTKPTIAPGLVLHPTNDPFGHEPLAGEIASALGARFERLDRVGHFWPYEAPDQAASVLRSFWASLP